MTAPKPESSSTERVDSISDTEDIESDDEVDPDMFEPSREHTFPDRKGEINDMTDEGIQARYKQALKESGADKEQELLKKYLGQNVNN